MSRDRGNRAPAWLADYLRPWWPHAEKTPNGRPGADLTGTPGVSFEVKTGVPWRNEWVRQALSYPGLPVLVHIPPGNGPRSIGLCEAYLPTDDILSTSSIVPLTDRRATGRNRWCVPMHVLMPLLVTAGYAPAPSTQEATTQ